MSSEIGARKVPPRLVVVLGMHRSGTSALTRGLTVLGVSLGNNLLPPVEDNNPTGFWEEREIYDLHNSMLRACGSDWDDLGPIAAAHLALCAGAQPREAVELAMRAAAVVVRKVGVATATPAEVMALSED